MEVRYLNAFGVLSISNQLEREHAQGELLQSSGRMGGFHPCLTCGFSLPGENSLCSVHEMGIYRTGFFSPSLAMQEF